MFQVAVERRMPERCSFVILSPVRHMQELVSGVSSPMLSFSLVEIEVSSLFVVWRLFLVNLLVLLLIQARLDWLGPAELFFERMKHKLAKLNKEEGDLYFQLGIISKTEVDVKES